MIIEQASALAGIAPQTLRNWVSSGIVEPAEGTGRGNGNGYKFSISQVVGLAVARALRDTERGCGLAWVRVVVTAFGAMGEAALLQRFQDRRRIFGGVSEDGVPLLYRAEHFKDCETIDVAAIFDAVKAKLAPAPDAIVQEELASK